jgi:hypothetical protein
MKITNKFIGTRDNWRSELVSNCRYTSDGMAGKDAPVILASGLENIQIMGNTQVSVGEVNGYLGSRWYGDSRQIESNIFRNQVDSHILTGFYVDSNPGRDRRVQGSIIVIHQLHGEAVLSAGHVSPNIRCRRRCDKGIRLSSGSLAGSLRRDHVQIIYKMAFTAYIRLSDLVNQIKIGYPDSYGNIPAGQSGAVLRGGDLN